MIQIISTLLWPGIISEIESSLDFDVICAQVILKDNEIYISHRNSKKIP